MFRNKTILVLSPHTDDGEIGCGGTILKAIKEQAAVYHVAFSIARASVPKGQREDILSEEFKEANDTLDVEDYWHYDYPVRHFPQYRQEILEEMIVLRDSIKPDIVFCPSSNDIHQDHNVVYNEAIRAFKYCTLLGYELIWNTFSLKTNLFVELLEKDIQNKIEIINKYQSQKSRRYMKGSNETYKLAEFSGYFVNVRYAESFEVIRAVIKF